MTRNIGKGENLMKKENEIVIFETKYKSISLPVTISKESTWINRNQMSELFGRVSREI